MIKRIPVSGRHNAKFYALIDAADFELVSRYSWRTSQHGYARTEVTVSGKRTIVWMHRLIMDCPPDMVVDHANRLPLDNRRRNLSIVTQAHNMGLSKTRRARNHDALIRYITGMVPIQFPLRLPIDDHSQPVRIPLSGATGAGQYALIDAADFYCVAPFTWWLSGVGEYASAHTRANGKKQTVKMHRLILGITDESTYVDHINGDKLDNRRSNLRIASRAENMRNSKAKDAKRTASIFKGVFKQGNGWQASICVDYQQIYLGFFGTQREAAQAYNDAATLHFGEFARLNDLTLIEPSDDPDIRTPQHSHYKGVSYHTKQRKWNAYAFVKGEQITIGSFDTELEAVKARDAYVIAHGLPLKINFP